MRSLEHSTVRFAERREIPGETIIKLYYGKRIDAYVTIAGDALFKVAPDGYTLEAVG